MKVTVWTYPGFWEAGAEGAVRALEELGYQASIRRVEDLEAYVAKATDQKTRGVQAGMVGWYGVTRTASLPPRHLHVQPTRSQLLLRPARRRPDRAGARAAGHDPDAAAAPWARIERDLVDLAPWVPLFTPAHAMLVSKRVGNYQYNPERRLLFDQLWVR